MNTGKNTDREFINLSPENIDSEHLCCIIRSKKPHIGIETKRKWLSERLSEGHIFHKLNVKGCVFIEYAPLEKAWVPILGDNYLYIYCLWVQGAPKGHGYGRKLMEYCINDAKAQGKSGICMLGAKKQKNWLSNQSFAKKYGFIKADETADGYELLALSFDGYAPRFSPTAKKQSIPDKCLTIYYSDQCPYISERISKLQAYCNNNEISAKFIHVDSLAKAKALPCVFNNRAVFYGGKFITVNQIDEKMLLKIIEKEEK